LLADALDLPADERHRWDQVRRARAAGPAGEAATSRQATAGERLAILPSRPTRFIGREHELRRLVALLGEAETRLVTLTGPGGVGKTRLALEVAASLLSDFANGVYFVDLVPVSDPDQVPATIAATLGVQSRADQPFSVTLVEQITGMRLLLVLDNLEQILSAAPHIAELLGACPDLKILATSRAPLRLRAEREFPVSPLPLPPIDGVMSEEAVAKSDAVLLFVDRARAVRPNFAVGDDLKVLARVCRRLDGLPLAIELAAACIRLFPPRTILARLEQQLPLVAGGFRDAPARQQTLRDTIAWSYGLLAPGEQALLRRVSIFKGGWTLDGAEAVAASACEPSGIDVLQGLATLIEHNLIQSQEWVDGTPRFTMLETIREFGLAQLQAHGEKDDTHRQHVTYLQQLFEPSEPGLQTAQDGHWLQRGDVEIENVRLALAWALDNDPEMGLRLARAFAWVWSMRGAVPESQHWLVQGLARAGDVADELRAGVLVWVGANSTTLGEFEQARLALEEAFATYSDLGNEVGVANSLHTLGRIAHFADDPDQACSLYTASADLLRRYHHPRLMVTLSNLGLVLAQSGKQDRASAVLDEALDLAERQGLPWYVCQILDGQASIALTRGDLQGARRALKRCVQLTAESGDPRFIAQTLETCAWLATAEGEAAQAARLLGAVSRLRDMIGVPVPLVTRHEYERYVPIARTQISDSRWKIAWAEGRDLSQADAIEAALQGLE
jgi:non-specific serine/threonine protein kinase